MTGLALDFFLTMQSCNPWTANLCIFVLIYLLRPDTLSDLIRTGNRCSLLSIFLFHGIIIHCQNYISKKIVCVRIFTMFIVWYGKICYIRRRHRNRVRGRRQRSLLSLCWITALSICYCASTNMIKLFGSLVTYHGHLYTTEIPK